MTSLDEAREGPRTHVREVHLHVTAHGYTLECCFRVAPTGEAEATIRAPFGAESESRRIEETIDLGPVMAWLDENHYDPASRREAGRVGFLRIVDHAGEHDVTFRRSAEVLEANPVNALIDWCGRHVPVLIGEEGG